MTRFLTIRRACFVLTLGILRTAGAATPTTAPSGIDAVDWVVLDVSVTQNIANDRDAWPSTLPPFVTSRRATAGADQSNQTQPVGVIHFFGTLDRESPTDVLLNLPGGDTQATWPRAQVKSNRILWSNLLPAEAGATPSVLDAPHWFKAVRDTDSARFRADRQVDSLLIYDVSLKFTPPLRLQLQNGKTTAANTGSSPMHGLTFYKPDKNGDWQRAAFAALPGRPAVKPSPATKPCAGRSVRFADDCPDDSADRPGDSAGRFCGSPHVRIGGREGKAGVAVAGTTAGRRRAGDRRRHAAADRLRPRHRRPLDDGRLPAGFGRPRKTPAFGNRPGPAATAARRPGGRARH
ncbi:MAG: hypothetical protein QM754_09560 [Tepidisphaeraceae bacterium]